MTAKHLEVTTAVEHLQIPGAEQNHMKVAAKKNAASADCEPSADHGNYSAPRSKQEANRARLCMSKEEIKGFLDNLM